MIGSTAGRNRYRVLDDGGRACNGKSADGGKQSRRGGLSVKVCKGERLFGRSEAWLQASRSVNEMTSSLRE